MHFFPPFFRADIDNYCVHFRRSDHQVDEAIFWEPLTRVDDYCPFNAVHRVLEHEIFVQKIRH